MRITAISGHGVKGPACFLVETAGPRFLLDCGEGPEAGRRPDLSGVGRVDALLVSHAHTDHVGALDLCTAIGDPPIHATALAGELGRVEKHGTLVPLPLSGETTIAGVPVLTGRAGHAPGGVWMRLGGPEGVLYTGDFSQEGLLFPVDPFPPARMLIADCSYGDYDAPLETGMAAILTLARSGPVLLPAPAGGRGLEMAVALHEAGLDLVLDPKHLEIGQTLLDRPDIIGADGCRRLAAALDAARPADPTAPPRGAVLAMAADLEAGMARELAQRWAGRAEIVFTGHLTAGGRADRLVQAGHARFIRWNVHPRLRDTLALLETVRPALLLPAFLSSARLPALEARLPQGLALWRPGMATL